MSFEAWDYYIEITIESDALNADLTDYPVYVNLADLPSSFFSNVASDGGDIRVTESDGTTEVPREVVSIDTGASTGELHFLASGTLSSTVDTTYRIYYGNAAASEPAASATYGSQNVWNSGYEAVWHLSEEPTSATALKDSTSNGNDSSAINGTMTSGDLVTAKIGNGIDFDGSDDYALFPNINLTTAITVQAWAETDGTQGLWFAHDNVGADRKWYMQHNSNFYFVNVFNDSNQNKNYRYAVTPSAMTMYHFSFTSNTLKMYVNGGNITGSVIKAADNTVTTLNDVTGLVSMGATNVGSFNSGTKLDEARISNVVRSDDWISAEYTNQNTPSSFYAVGTPVFQGTSAEQPALFFGANF